MALQSNIQQKNYDFLNIFGLVYQMSIIIVIYMMEVKKFYNES